MNRFARAWAIAALCCGVAGLALAHGPSFPPGLGSAPAAVGSAPAAFGGSWLGAPAPATPRFHLDTGERGSESARRSGGERRWSDDDQRADPSARRLARYSSGSRGSSFGSRSYSLVSRPANGPLVCVRLCDGYFFPSASTQMGAAACASQCPDAPTELYVMTSDRIDDAVSAATGTPYTKLHVAKAYQTSHDSTCSCRRDAIASGEKELMHDATLRQGDIVMTGEGFKVFAGGGWGAPTTPKDFVSVARIWMSKEQRNELAAMEHASAPAPLTLIAAERPKGAVTVENAPSP